MKRKPAESPAAEPAPKARLGFGEAPATDPASNRSPIEQDELDQQTKILELLSRHRDSGGYIEIYAKPPGEMNFGFLTTIPVEAYSLQKLADKFGGGDYKLCAKTAEHKYVTTWLVTVDHSVPPVRQGTTGAAAASDTAAIVKQVTELIVPLLKQQPAPPAPDSTMKEFMPAIVAAISRPEPDTGKQTEFFKMILDRQDKAEERMMAVLEKIAEKKEAPDRGNRLRDVIEDIQAIEELRGDGGGEKKGSTFFEDMARAFAPALAPLLQQMVANGSAANGQAPAPRQPVLPPAPNRPGAAPAPIRNVTPSPSAPTAAAAANPDDEMNIQLKMMLGQFKSAALNAARKAQDPAEFSLSMLSMVPELYHPQIFSAANADDWFAKLFASDPEATKHLDFMTEIRNTILARSVVFVAKANLQTGAAPEATGRVIVDSLSKSFHGYLFDETDKENWSALFQGEEIPRDWLESLRVTIDNLLGGEEKTDPAPGVAGADATSTSARNGVVGS